MSREWVRRQHQVHSVHCAQALLQVRQSLDKVENEPSEMHLHLE